MIADEREWRTLAAANAEELMVDNADILLQSGRWEAFRKGIYAQGAKLVELQR